MRGGLARSAVLVSTRNTLITRAVLVRRLELPPMEIAQYTMWQEQGQWHGYLRDYPDHQVQGESFEDLQLKLCRMHRDLANRKAPGLPAPHRAA